MDVDTSLALAIWSTKVAHMQNNGGQRKTTVDFVSVDAAKETASRRF
jgi:hypothetical protein